MASRSIQAAGSVVYRTTEFGQLRVCVIHRPRYNDWSFPKGKLDADESLIHAAVRETAEETGVHIVLQAPLARISYVLGADNSDAVVSNKKARTGVKKYVSYWIARDIPVHMLNARSASFGQIIHRTVNETDEIRWLSIDDALNLLTRADDKNILLDFSRRVSAHQQHSCTLIIARQASAISKKKWGGSSPSRPLSPLGAAQAHALVTELSCYMPHEIYTDTTVACQRTAEPWHNLTHLPVRALSHADESASKHSHRGSNATEHNPFVSQLEQTMENIMQSSLPCAALIVAKQHLSSTADFFSPLAADPTVSRELIQILRGKKALAPGQAVALTIESNPCTVTSVQKVEPIVF